MLRFAFLFVFVVHALLHLLGPGSAFGWFATSPLRSPVSMLGGVLCLAAAILLLGAAAAFMFGAPWWWWPAIPGVVLSQLLIAGAWHDARFGTLANVLIAVPLLLAAIDARPSSFRSRFARDHAALLARPTQTAAPVSDADIASLPPLYQTYLRRYVAGAATFHVRIASLWPMVDKAGPVLIGAESAMLMNDIVVLAPADVLDLPFTWSTIGVHTVHATFTNAGHTVGATLTFDAAGDLVGFVSNDRTQEDASGSKHIPWSTPISEYREIDGIRVGSRGNADWVETSGAWTYGEFTVRALAYNVLR